MLEADVVRGMSDLASRGLHGRRQIFTGVSRITRENVLEVLNKALQVHHQNREDEMYLRRYVRGIQPILLRQKQVNGEINNKIVVNLADQIVSFKTAEFAGEPITYISRKGSAENVPEKVACVNDMMLSEGKQTKDIDNNLLGHIEVWPKVVEDYKGYPNDRWPLKKAMMLYFHGIAIREVKKPTEPI